MTIVPDDRDNEEILWQNRPAWRDFIGTLAFGIVLIPLIGLGVLVLLYVIILRFRCLYVVTERRVSCSIGIMSRHVSEVDIVDLRDISLHQSFIQKILRTGDVGFSSAGQGGVEVLFRGVSRPERIKEMVRRRKRQLQQELYRSSRGAEFGNDE